MKKKLVIAIIAISVFAGGIAFAQTGIERPNTDFSDVPEDHWARPSIQWFTGGHCRMLAGTTEWDCLMEGYGDGTFGVDDPMTRGQFTKTLYEYNNRIVQPNYGAHLELQTRVSELETKVSDLEARLSALENTETQSTTTVPVYVLPPAPIIPPTTTTTKTITILYETEGRQTGKLKPVQYYKVCWSKYGQSTCFDISTPFIADDAACATAYEGFASSGIEPVNGRGLYEDTDPTDCMVTVLTKYE